VKLQEALTICTASSPCRYLGSSTRSPKAARKSFSTSGSADARACSRFFTTCGACSGSDSAVQMKPTKQCLTCSIPVKTQQQQGYQIPDPTAQLSDSDLQTWPGAYCSKVASSAPNVIGESMLPLKGSRILPFLRCRRMCCLGCRCKYHRSSIRLLGHVWFRGMRDAIWHMPILLMLPDTNVLRQGPAHGQTWSRSVHERIQHFCRATSMKSFLAT